MTFEELKKRAYHDHPIPDGLNKTERLQYIAARRIYAGYKSGEIDRTEAEPMLGKVQDYPRLMAAEKRALLRYLFALLCEDAGCGMQMLMCGKVTHMTLDSGSLFLYLTTGCILVKLSRISTVIKES